MMQKRANSVLIEYEVIETLKTGQAFEPAPGVQLLNVDIRRIKWNM